MCLSYSRAYRPGGFFHDDFGDRSVNWLLLLLPLIAIVILLPPIFRPGRDEAADRESRLDTLREQKRMLIAAIRELDFDREMGKLSAGDHPEARRLLRHFRSSYPKDPRVDQAQLMLGNSWYAEQKFAPAIVEYKKIVEQHKKSKVYPDALYKIGMAFYQLKFCSDAKLFLSQLVKRHRRHQQAKRARKVLKLIRRYRRNRAFCR